MNARNVCKRYSRALLVMLVFHIACTTARADMPSQPLRSVLEEYEQRGLAPVDWARWKLALSQFYVDRELRPAWTHEGVPNRAATALLQELARAEERGLRASDYAISRLTIPVAKAAERSADRLEDAALLDVAFSISVARFVSDLHAGRIDPKALGHELEVSRAPLDLAKVLAELMRAAGNPVTLAAALDRLEPPWQRYALLKRTLSRYRVLAAQPALHQVPPPVKWPVTARDRYAGAPELRRLLQALGDMPQGKEEIAAEEIFDESLSAALTTFQFRHGLHPSGRLDRHTYDALTVPLSTRVRQIELSLERMRWLPVHIATPPIVVNIPQYRLFAFHTTEDREDAILSMDVIVGQEFEPLKTPVFAADMRYVVFRPYWDVPRGILTRTLLPRIKADPQWVRKNGFEIIGVPQLAPPAQDVGAETIAALQSGRARLRQRPGPRNALGNIKFISPNRYSVYLHDTPESQLFSESRRAFSNGCVRVSDPIALAEYVLRENGGWTRERIIEAMRGDLNKRVDLARPIRIYVIYATALAMEDGTVRFFEDVYGHDARLDAVLRP